MAENLNYAGVVTRLLQPILPVFFAVQVRVRVRVRARVRVRVRVYTPRLLRGPGES